MGTSDGNLGQRRPVLVGFAIGLAVAATLLGLSWLTAEVPAPTSNSGGYIRMYSPPHSRLEVLLNRGDGQAYAALAQDPLLQDPQSFLDGANESFYAHRPLLPAILAVGSLGQPGLVPLAAAVAVVVAGGLFVAAGVLLIQVVNPAADPRFGWLLIALPGSVAALRGFEPGLLALALAMFATALWLRDEPREGAAAALLVAACLGRETMLVFSFALAVDLVWRHRFTWRRAILLGLGPVAYGLWAVGIELRRSPADNAVTPVGGFGPITGLLDSLPGWTPADWLIALIGLALAVSALVKLRRGPLFCLIAGYLVFGLVLGAAVWDEWLNFARVLLPIYVLSIIAVLPPAVPASRVVEPAGSSGDRA